MRDSHTRFWFVRAADLSILRIDAADVLRFDVDDAFVGPGLVEWFYCFDAQVKGRLRIRWFLWRHGPRRLSLRQRLKRW